MTSARKQRPVKNIDFQTAFRSDCTVLAESCMHVFAVDVSRGQPFYWKAHLSGDRNSLNLRVQW